MSDLKLYITIGFTGESQEISSDVSADLIISTVTKLDWHEFKDVTLEKDDNNWISVSGNLGADGLSGVYCESGNINVTSEAPKSIQTLIDILLSYFNGDDKYKDLFPNDNETILESEAQQRRFSEWKSKYDNELKRDKKNQIKKTLLIGLVSILIFSLGYLLISGELRFFLHDTEIAKAKINKTAMLHLGYGSYTQRIEYQFEYEETIYHKTVKTIKLPILKEGDYLKIKFSTRNPNKVEIIGYYRKQLNKPKPVRNSFEVKSGVDSIVKLTPDSIIRINKTKPNKM